jgi:hypothetical protein
MTTGVALWLVIGAVSAALFFGIAAVVAVLGVRDLKRLFEYPPDPKV